MTVVDEAPLGFGTRLRDAMTRVNALCIGIDPHSEALKEVPGGDTLAGLTFFVDSLLGASVGAVATIKPQVAFFERFGSKGMAELERLTYAAHEAGILVIADAKRGDISTTLQGYADAWLKKGSPFYCDALTLSPYLGVNALKPAFTTAFTYGKGLFILAATSNAEAESLQEATTRDGVSLSVDVASQVSDWNSRAKGLEAKIAQSVTGLTDKDFAQWRSEGYFGQHFLPDDFISFVDVAKARWIKAREHAGADSEAIKLDFEKPATVSRLSKEIADWAAMARPEEPPLAVLERYRNDDSGVLAFEEYSNWYHAVVGSNRVDIGPFGLVVGATIAPERIASTLGEFAIGPESLPILAPGFGAQGARLRDIHKIFGNRSGDVLANVSRSVLKYGIRNASKGVADAVRELADAPAA